MKNLLKYLLSVILAVITLSASTDDSGTSVTKDVADESIATTVPHAYDSLTSDEHLYLPSQTSGTPVFRVPTASQRTPGSNDNPFEFIKVSKMSPTGIRNFIDKTSLTIHSSFIRPSHRLISLGKLLI